MSDKDAATEITQPFSVAWNGKEIHPFSLDWNGPGFGDFRPVFSNPSASVVQEKEDVLEDDEYDEDEVTHPKDSSVQEPVKSSPVVPSEGDMPF